MRFHVLDFSAYPATILGDVNDLRYLAMGDSHGWVPSVGRINNPLLRPQGTQGSRRIGARPLVGHRRVALATRCSFYPLALSPASLFFSMLFQCLRFSEVSGT